MSLVTLNGRKILRVGKCWYLAGRDGRPIRNKRPNVQIDGVRRYASNWIYEQAHGKIVNFVLHTCDDEACVYIAHLFDGTKSQNTRQAIARGRFYQLNMPKTWHRGKDHWRVKRRLAKIEAKRGGKEKTPPIQG